MTLKTSPLFRTVALVAVSVLLMASCGGDDSADETGVADTSEVSSDASTDGADSSAAVEAATAVPGGAVDDLSGKPALADDLLGDVGELTLTDVVVGSGAVAESGSSISTQYVGYLAADGTEFDSSWSRGAEPLSFDLGRQQVIAGWDQGIIGMKVGGRRIIQIPSDLAYGAAGAGADIGPDADLVFIVDLVDVAPPPEPAPEIPSDALGAVSELGIIDLVEGSGRAVQAGDIAKVQYVGVGADDGVEFDSSWARNGEPFPLVVGRGQVIEGWDTGLLGMKVGGERILQIPAAQAYNDGDLVFRVHLEELVESPIAHTITFSGAAPTDMSWETLVEGSGDGAVDASEITLDYAVVNWNSNVIASSSWVDEQWQVLSPSQEGLLPGLGEGLVGIKVGETRQIVVPTGVAFDDGPPEGAGLDADDAIVFIVEAIAIR